MQLDLPDNPWLELRRLTPARIALGRTGTSIPTNAQLDFQFAHAQARDAVHLPFDHAGLSSQLAERGRDSLLLHSAATDRHSYLQRPDLGRRLSDESAQSLRDYAAAPTPAAWTWRWWWPMVCRRWQCINIRCRFLRAWKNRPTPKAGPCRR